MDSAKCASKGIKIPHKNHNAVVPTPNQQQCAVPMDAAPVPRGRSESADPPGGTPNGFQTVLELGKLGQLFCEHTPVGLLQTLALLKLDDLEGEEGGGGRG